jgi:hypothetical protein
MKGMAAAEQEKSLRPPDTAFLIKVFYVFAALALLSVLISIGGKLLGRSIVMAGHTDDATIHEIVIGNNVISAPANAIRFEANRRDGVAERLELYLRWPDMRGYTAEAHADFNHAGGSRRILFLSFAERMMSRDMSGRFEPIYRSMIVAPGKSGPAHLTLYDFDPKSGYTDEILAVAERRGSDPFVARCLSGESAAASLAPCERDIHLGDGLSLTYRFPAELLANWQALDAAVLGTAVQYLQTER